MLNDKIQKQEGGDSSTNLQGHVVNVYQGISYADAKEIALDVFSSNFIQLKNEAAEIAKQRAEEITEALLEKLIERAPDAIEEFKQPGMQDSLFTAQKEYAKSGDKELGDLLVDILVDRANSPERNMMQIILDEALKIAPKLTIEQLDTLTLSFILIRTVRRV
ncbi:LPO_1073/Vpar_1526 family protein [Parapedobacter soli]|uniref:LPO_1073/Vpar_1526 family protein n=1 Tax=Parapedobacter soli TaxID=416955 RepID=UPI0021C6958C|nr:LPO_1073/Vpar_1526 family protein [Parapedobacter soli]